MGSNFAIHLEGNALEDQVVEIYECKTIGDYDTTIKALATIIELIAEEHNRNKAYVLDSLEREAFLREVRYLNKIAKITNLNKEETDEA